MENKTTLEIECIDSDMFRADLKIGPKIVSSGYFTNYKIDDSSTDFVMVYLYKNSDIHLMYYAVDKVEIIRQKVVILPKNVFEGIPVLYWLHPDSTNILKYQYDPQAKELHIIFKSNIDRLYTYSDVPAWVYIGLFNAESKGSYFHYHIKGNFNFERVEL